MTIADAKYDVGGVVYDRPFKIRRMNHFGISVDDTGEAVKFYRDVLGFVVSDTLDTAKHDPGPWLDGVPDTNIYFTPPQQRSPHLRHHAAPVGRSCGEAPAGRHHDQPDHVAGGQPARSRRGTQVARQPRSEDRSIRA